MADPFSPVSMHLLNRFEISGRNPDSYPELIDVLAVRIAEMLQHSPDSLMSMLYRLDISEKKLKAALHPETKELPEYALAKLIVERQSERMQTRQKYSSPPKSD